MRIFYVNVAIILITNFSVFSMQLARVAKTRSSICAVARNYATKPQDDAKKQKQTIIFYKGNDYTPLELAQYAVLQGLAASMHVVKKCIDPNVECKCAEQYAYRMRVKTDDSVYAHHNDAVKQLKNAAGYLKNDGVIGEELISLQKSICPNSHDCFVRLCFQAIKKPAAVIGIGMLSVSSTTLLGLVVPMIAVYGGFKALEKGMKKSDLVKIEFFMLRSHLYEETEIINAALKKAEPYIMEKAKLQKEPTAKVATQTLYLPLPKKKD